MASNVVSGGYLARPRALASQYSPFRVRIMNRSPTQPKSNGGPGLNHSNRRPSKRPKCDGWYSSPPAGLPGVAGRILMTPACTYTVPLASSNTWPAMARPSSRPQLTNPVRASFMTPFDHVPIQRLPAASSASAVSS
jgi:hypothetical protein